ncbi:hypothetical protein LPW26_24730 [Rhodopseudomonas sp. HC1]|uniref:hypothetical protein n=1 Tax=Rhodopseudomonas infernalis TaxID=2897386 RepID=UPI001EE8B397|nr:hypothetical protein [Rhodopseudomonas infernalis]MCG6207868.1 hypothetical protein [Rhodopseudomonas infernalis]
MTDPNTKQINREMADNESARQTASSVRISTFAIAITIVIALAVFGWMFFR